MCVLSRTTVTRLSAALPRPPQPHGSRYVDEPMVVGIAPFGRGADERRQAGERVGAAESPLTRETVRLLIIGVRLVVGRHRHL
eukprot:scaffold5313_cov90-Isochrysis_galbana.AAC.3